MTSIDAIWGRSKALTKCCSNNGRNFFLALAIAAFSLNISNTAASAQTNYPSRTIRVIVPLPPGPVADLLPRIIGDKLSSKWGQAVVIENRPGAGSNIGADSVARAEGDGYTLLATPPAPLVIAQHFYPSLPFDPTKFVPVSVMVKLPAVLVVNPKVPASSFPELVAYAKANPDKLSYGSPGLGQTPQLAMVKLMAAAGIQFQHVPYQGMAPASRDLLAGHIDIMIDNLGNVMDYIKGGQLKLIATTSDARLPQFPDVPTVAETLPGVTHTDWLAVVAPQKTPPAIAMKLSQSIAEILKMPDVAQRLEILQLTAVGSTPAEAAKMIAQESERWRQVIAAAGLKAQ
jgi:tripartite-type tricarboxylate transporter receptor subunit TctC